MPSAQQLSRTLGATARCLPLVGILDSRFAAGRSATIGRRVKAASGWFVRRQVECRAIVWSCELRIEPTKELRARSHRRHALVFDRRENGAADQNFASGIALAFCLADARDEPALLCVQTSEPFVDRLKTIADFVGLRHVITSLCEVRVMQVQCRARKRRDCVRMMG
jgi:hypothetical protein